MEAPRQMASGNHHLRPFSMWTWTQNDCSHSYRLLCCCVLAHQSWQHEKYADHRCWNSRGHLYQYESHLNCNKEMNDLACLLSEPLVPQHWMISLENPLIYSQTFHPACKCLSQSTQKGRMILLAVTQRKLWCYVQKCNCCSSQSPPKISVLQSGQEDYILSLHNFSILEETIEGVKLDEFRWYGPRFWPGLPPEMSLHYRWDIETVLAHLGTFSKVKS